VLITLDTVRADHTSVYGYNRDTTPHLVELAARGVVFEHAYAAASDTQRALMPLVSGKRYSQTAHDKREWPTIQGEVDTIAERMKRAGYATAAVASFTWLSEDRGFAQGFDRFEPVYREAHPERSVTGALAARAALAILDDLSKKPEPFFLWIHLFDAHERYLEHEGPRLGPGQTGLYDGEIAFVDKQVGQIWKAVEGSPRAANVAWIVHGSHGEGMNEHGEKGHGLALYDEMIRVPLIVVPPAASRGPANASRYGAGAVSTLDIAPTVLALAGGGAPDPGFQGESLLPLQRRTDSPAALFAETHVDAVDLKAALLGTVKCIENAAGVDRNARPAARFESFDLARDPRERTPLPASNRGGERCRRELAAWLAQPSAAPVQRGPLAPEDRAKLRALGYLR